MNKYIVNSFLAGIAALTLAGCGENSWNDTVLDGFEGGVVYDNAVTGTYNLTADDYETISKLMLAKATNKADSTEAKAIANNLYFDKNGVFNATVALPPFMETANFPYYLGPNGSSVDVGYAECDTVPAELTSLAGATVYTVSKNDYISAWGSEVDYISAFAPMTSAENKLPGILKNALPNAEKGAFAIVSYNESATNPVFIADSSEAEEFIGGSYYMVADGSVGAAPFKYSYTYGNLNTVDMTVANGTVESDPFNAFTFAPTNDGYYLIDVYGRYLYQSGTYNNFNVSYTVPASGGIWTVDVASNGAATIVNVDTEKTVQYSGGKWGAFKDVTGSIPTLYKAPYPQFYLVTEEGKGAGLVKDEKAYGYLIGVDMTVTDGAVDTESKYAYTFELTSEGYYIKDSQDRYLYMTGDYNNFNRSENLPESGAIWTVATNADATVTIKNLEMDKWIQYDASYGTWGSYDSQKGVNPKMYNAAVKPAATSMPTRVVAGTPATSGKNAVYYFDGSAWALAEGVSILNPADYTAMGFENKDMSSPEIYIPLYLKNKLIYAQAGDMQFVVYNENKADLFVFDGANWSLNDNGLENVVGRYTRNNGDWSFLKYIGKETFDEFKEDQIMLDRSYLIAYGNICATPVPIKDFYGYLKATNIQVNEGVVVMPSDANAFTFATSFKVEDIEYKAPEGKFFIVDSNSRYYYCSGTYSSTNVTDNDYTYKMVTDGQITEGYLWSAERNEDGTWNIINDRGEGNVRSLVFSESHTNFAVYTSISEEDHYPTLYLME